MNFVFELPPLVTMALNAGLAVLLLASCVALERRKHLSPRNRSIVYGVIFGGLSIVTMAIPVSLAPGFQLDARLPLIMLASPFGGGWASPIAAILSGGYRMMIGGGGATAGMIGALVAGVVGVIISRRDWLGGTWAFPGFVLLGIYTALQIYVLLWFFSDQTIAGEIISGQWGAILVSSIMFNLVIGGALFLARQQVDEHQELMDSRKLVDAIFENSRDLIALVDFEGRVTRIGSTYANLLGYEPHELFGRDLTEFLQQDEVSLARDRLSSVSEGERPSAPSEYHVRAADGSWHLISTDRMVIADNGKPTGLLVSSRDETERRDAEAALASSEARLRSIVDNAPISILLKDVEGRFIVVGQEFTRRYGLKAEDMLGKTDHDLHAKVFADASREIDEEILATGRPKTVEVAIQFIDGREHDVIITKFPVLNDAGETTALGSISVDVTEQREIEAQLQQAQKMEAVGQLTGGIAHDFNNILMAAQGNLEFLGERAEFDDKALATYERIVSAIESGAALTSRLLTFSRKQFLEPAVVDPASIVRNMAGLLARSIGENISIDIMASDDLWLSKVDVAQLESAVLNLSLNARDSMPNGGRLSIDCSNFNAEAEDAERLGILSGDYVTIQFADVGGGIDPDIRDRIFEPFFTTKERGKGSGLGMSMVYGFAKQSDGGVSVDSELGKGTTISLYLPRTNEQLASGEASAAVLEVSNAPIDLHTILIVEDDPAVREFAVSAVASMGHDVKTAACADEALQVIASNRQIGLVLSDILLGEGLTGLELAKEVQANNPDLPFVFMTGYADPEKDILPTGRTEAILLRKPFRRHELAEAISSSLGSMSGKTSGVEPGE